MLNIIIIQGRIVRDPELRRTGSGIAVASFTVAVDRDFAQDGKKETDFIDCVAWRQTGEFVSKYFRKGSMIVVKGRLQIRNWTDKDGNKRKSAEVVADNCYFGGGKSDSDGGSTHSDNTYGGGYNESRFPETDAMLQKYGMPTQYPGGDYAVIEDDDAQLPFTV